MDRRKRMHGRKRRSSPVKLSYQSFTGDGPTPQLPTGFGPMKPQGENQTNYNPDKQRQSLLLMEARFQEAQKQMQKQMQLQQPQGGGGGSHTHSVKVDGHSDSGGYQSPASGAVNPYKALNRGMFGSGVNDPNKIMNASPMAKKNKK